MDLPDLKENIHTFESAMQIHNYTNPYANFFELKLPFMVQLATCRPSDPECCYHFSLFAPNYHKSVSFGEEIRLETQALHQLNCVKLMYVLEGTMYQLVENKKILYLPGSCCLLNRDIRHAEEFTTDYQVIFITFNDSFINRLKDFETSFLFDQEKTQVNIFMQYLFSSIDTKRDKEKRYIEFIPIFSGDFQRKQMHDIFESMISALLHPQYGTTYQIYYLFCQLTALLSSENNYHATSVCPASGMDSLIFTRINQILYDSKGRISRAELEQKLNYSGSYINRIVKKFTGMSLFQYSMTFCLNAAADMLKNTDESISSIIQSLNFTNQTHFYNLFKDKYGMSPSEYRNSK